MFNGEFKVGMRFRLTKDRMADHGSADKQKRYCVSENYIHRISRIHKDGTYAFMQYPNPADGELTVYKKHIIPLTKQPIIIIKE